MPKLHPENLKWLTVFADEQAGLAQMTLGKLLLVNLKAYGKRIALGYSQGEWVAISDYCPHKGASMAMGWLNSQQEAVCPLHNYCYSVHSGKETSGQGGPDLELFYTRVLDGKVQVGISDTTPLVQSS